MKDAQRIHLQPEHSSCGVGFVASKHNASSHETLQMALHALHCNEHRGACAEDGVTGDGAGIMADIPHEVLGYPYKKFAVACLFTPLYHEERRQALSIFEKTFAFFGMEILEYRSVPINTSVLGRKASETLPYIVHAIIDRPEHCRTDYSFDKLLYQAKQSTLSRITSLQLKEGFFFTSLSTDTIVYKALVKSAALEDFYPDLKNPQFKTKFALFHRRFSTNTSSSWDKAQPFRQLGHNGEINTINGNRAWGEVREKALGLERNELLTHGGISDSGTLNEMVEALMYRSSIPELQEILSLMMPPADKYNEYYEFWSRAMEPWDGPALVSFSDGHTVGARLDRNGFRPCRWLETEDYFFLASEAGSFKVDERNILRKGALNAGSGVYVDIEKERVIFEDTGEKAERLSVSFESRLKKLPFVNTQQQEPKHFDKQYLFNYTDEEFKRIIIPMIADGKEPIGSMGDTARLALFSELPRPLTDYFYHNFAQVTNPPLDYLREKVVTNLRSYLGKTPNIFSTKELIPTPAALEIPSPVLSLGQMEAINSLNLEDGISSTKLDMIYDKTHGAVGLKSTIKQLQEDSIEAVEKGARILILSDRAADFDYLPVPALLALSAVVKALKDKGILLETSIVMDTAEVRTTHQLAAMVGFGAAAVCPYLVLELARFHHASTFGDMGPEEKEKQVTKALESGLLKIMAKMGISVVRSYQNSRLFAAIGLDKTFIEDYFPNISYYLGGKCLEDFANQALETVPLAKEQAEKGKLVKTFQLREHPRGKKGEMHSMTNARSKIIHQLVRDQGLNLSDMALFDEYLKLANDEELLHIRHLLQPAKLEQEVEVDEVQPIEEILPTFGSGAMSFGALSAESQRDIFKAMEQIGGRSNSGEGGENPYYYEEGITAAIKQLASGRFGVNARYLITSNEIQIKIAQGAKPGEGGQLMGKKVNQDIAFARSANPGVSLISPPPLHDIYSIEDLKQLIYELKQLKPGVKVNVKLVAGAHIGTIALGVAKAGADIIHISGGDGGTGAAPISSMRHAGLPWEIGLAEVHRILVANGMRKAVTLRTDGGLSSGRDIVLAAALGAEEFEFGKLLLVAQGCVMARICEKNTCPTGIATHNPKFKKKYKGQVEHIVDLLKYLAQDVRRELAQMGARSLKDITGHYDLIEANDTHKAFIERYDLDMSLFTGDNLHSNSQGFNHLNEEVNLLNQQILKDAQEYIKHGRAQRLEYGINTEFRAVPSTLYGAIASEQHKQHMAQFTDNKPKTNGKAEQVLQMTFLGSAGQSFAAYNIQNIHIKLFGDANDGVGKTMSGGEIVVVPHPESKLNAAENTILGNCALYGATAGKLFVSGRAGARFAVRNSGATAVVDSVGLHACEYMTRGFVIILGEASGNIGAGMTGGQLVIHKSQADKVNRTYLTETDWSADKKKQFLSTLKEFQEATGSLSAAALINSPDPLSSYLFLEPKEQHVDDNVPTENTKRFVFDRAKNRVKAINVQPKGETQ